MSRIFKTLLWVFISIMAVSCVSTKQFKELSGRNERCQALRDNLMQENESLSVENNELKSRSASLQALNEELTDDSIRLTSEIQLLQSQLANLEDRNNQLLASQKAIIDGSLSETRQLLRQLQTTQEDLQNRDDDLRKLEQALTREKSGLDQARVELELRNSRLKELENILARKDSAVNALRSKVASALMGFEGQGLIVTQKNGKVYVSLDEKLLFETGSTVVGANGIAALRRLAVVLEQNPDINITIEGHTDDVPFKAGSAIKDNWDLSVLRATSIVRIILDNKGIDPKRFNTSGRGEFLPIDPAKNADARRKNRRTEIILTPRLDELFQILENN